MAKRKHGESGGNKNGIAHLKASKRRRPNTENNKLIEERVQALVEDWKAARYQSNVAQTTFNILIKWSPADYSKVVEQINTQTKHLGPAIKQALLVSLYNTALLLIENKWDELNALRKQEQLLIEKEAQLEKEVAEYYYDETIKTPPQTPEQEDDEDEERIGTLILQSLSNSSADKSNGVAFNNSSSFSSISSNISDVFQMSVEGKSTTSSGSSSSGPVTYGLGFPQQWQKIAKEWEGISKKAGGIHGYISKMLTTVQDWRVFIRWLEYDPICRAIHRRDLIAINFIWTKTYIHWSEQAPDLHYGDSPKMVQALIEETLRAAEENASNVATTALAGIWEKCIDLNPTVVKAAIVTEWKASLLDKPALASAPGADMIRGYLG